MKKYLKRLLIPCGICGAMLTGMTASFMEEIQYMTCLTADAASDISVTRYNTLESCEKMYSESAQLFYCSTN